MDDRSWMYRRMKSGRLNPEYIAGVRRFINFAYSIDKNISEGKIRCPCMRCKNQKFQKEDDVCKHLLTKGFLPFYENWTVHGEPYVTDILVGPSSGGIGHVVNDKRDANPYRNMAPDAVEDGNAYYNDRVCSTVRIEEPPNPEAANFFKLLKADGDPLWDGGDDINVRSSEDQDSVSSNHVSTSPPYNNDRVCSTVRIEEPPNPEAANFFKLLKADGDPLWDVGDDINVRSSEDQDSVSSNHVSTSSPYNKSVKRKGFDTEIDPLTKKRKLSLYGTTEFNNSSCGREIGRILRANFKGAWHSWEKVDSVCKDEQFKEFKKKYTFPEEDEQIVRNIWEDKARISLNQQLARARNKAMSIMKTTNIIDCLDKGPIWIQNDDWNTMIKDVWSTVEFQRRSESSRRNRLTKTDGKISTHSGGSVLFASYRASMQEQAGGKKLPWDDVFSILHRSANETGTFVDNKSKTVVENYKKEMIAKYGPNRENHPSFDGAAWCVASGGVSKGRVYGAPRMPKSKVNVSSSSHSYSVQSAYPSTATRGYKEELQAQDDIITEMRNEIASIKDYLKILVGSCVRSEYMGQGMPTPMASSMPSHAMAPMGPVSSSIYRPRLQLPYNGPSSSHPQHRRLFPP